MVYLGRSVNQRISGGGDDHDEVDDFDVNPLVFDDRDRYDEGHYSDDNHQSSYRISPDFETHEDYNPNDRNYHNLGDGGTTLETLEREKYKRNSRSAPDLLDIENRNDLNSKSSLLFCKAYMRKTTNLAQPNLSSFLESTILISFRILCFIYYKNEQTDISV